MSYHLSNVISDGENHVILHNKNTEPVIIEVIESTHIYAKIPCKGYYSPCRLSLEYYSKGNLKVFMSYSNKSPTNGDPNTYNASYGKSKRLFFSAPGRDKTFQNEYIYLSFYSYEGISLGLKVLF